MSVTTDAARTGPESTSSATTRILGLIALAGLALLLAYALVWSPADRVQQDSVRIMYVHVPTAILAFTACAICTVAAIGWLRKRSEGWWVLGGAAAEIGVLFTGLALLTGSIWGRPTWGTYWDWDPRITSTTLLFVMLVGFLALRRIDNESGDAAQRGTRSAIAGLLLFPNVIVVHFSVDWWRSLHQTATITRLDPTIEGTMLFTLMLGIAVFGCCFAWLLVHRFRVGWLEEQVGRSGLDEALAERRAEAGIEPGVPSGATS
ncbi:MAG: cytochrome c biogenesis protein CcsA [Actinomycetota bacterium]|nr:cytochrome c biogenesis protein CcsA [Actinomycetota bacterium]